MNTYTTFLLHYRKAGQVTKEMTDKLIYGWLAGWLTSYLASYCPVSHCWRASWLLPCQSLVDGWWPVGSTKEAGAAEEQVGKATYRLTMPGLEEALVMRAPRVS